jgi:hypothetical protein
MNKLNNSAYINAHLPQLAKKQSQQILNAFWIIALGLFIYELFFTNTTSLFSNLSAILITFSALVPSYLWCSKRAQGMPIYPIFALTFIWTYALPLVSDYPSIIIYSPEEHLFAGITTSAFLIFGTVIWFQFVKNSPQTPKSYRLWSSKYSNHFFIFFLLLSTVLNMFAIAGWISLESGFIPIFQSTILALTAVSSFVLGYKLGTKELSKVQANLFIFALTANMIINAVSLLLIITGSTALISICAFIIGRRKIPILPIVIIFICLSLLHYGKAEMRAKYWQKVQSVQVQPWEYPAWYSEWIGYTFNYINKEENLSKRQKKQSFIERSSVVQMLLLSQVKSPETLPYLNGETYTIIPQLLVPRIFNKNKIISNAGTNMLSVHYGLQSSKANYVISWGLLAESYANFGLFGCGGLAIILGTFYGISSRWSINAPILSAQSLFSVLVITYALQPEFTAGVYISSFFQSSSVLCIIIMVFMKNKKTQRLTF